MQFDSTLAINRPASDSDSSVLYLLPSSVYPIGIPVGIPSAIPVRSVGPQDAIFRSYLNAVSLHSAKVQRPRSPYTSSARYEPGRYRRYQYFESASQHLTQLKKHFPLTHWQPGDGSAMYIHTYILHMAYVIFPQKLSIYHSPQKSNFITGKVSWLSTQRLLPIGNSSH